MSTFTMLKSPKRQPFSIKKFFLLLLFVISFASVIHAQLPPGNPMCPNPVASVYVDELDHPTCYPIAYNGQIAYRVVSLNSNPIIISSILVLVGHPGVPLAPGQGQLLQTGPNTFSLINLREGYYCVIISTNQGCTTLDVPLICEPPQNGPEGCTPGFWKNNTISWGLTSYATYRPLGTLFTFPSALSSFNSVTMLNALAGGGGSGLTGATTILLRAAVAALLNANHPYITYTQDDDDWIINAVNMALASGDRDKILALASQLDAWNNAGCPINAHGEVETAATRAKPTVELPVATDLNLQALSNPTNGAFKVQVQSNSPDKITMRVVDMQGRLIEQSQKIQQNQTLELGQNYRQGVYLIEVSQGAKSKQLRLVKSMN